VKRFLYLLEALLITALAADFYFFPSSGEPTRPPAPEIASVSIRASMPHTQPAAPRTLSATGKRSPASKPPAEAPSRKIAARAPASAVPAEPSPPPVEAAKEPGPQEFSPRSQLDLSFGGEYFRIDAKDLSTNASAQILSKLSPSVSAAWKLRFTENYASLLGVSLRKDRIEPFAGASKRIQGDGTSALFYAGVERSKSGGRSRILLGQEDILYTRAQSAQSIELTRVPVPYISLEHAQEVFRRQTAAAGIGAKISAHAPASATAFRAKSGYGGKLFLFLSHQMEAASLRGELFYGQRKADSTIAKQNVNSAGISMAIEWGKP
jgi:hypothetical protein